MPKRFLTFAMLWALWAMPMAALDATLEIITSSTKPPFIVVEHIADNNEYGQKLLSQLVGDLKVSNHFQVEKGESVKDREPDLQTYKDKKIDLIARVSASKRGGGIAGRLVLYDVRNAKKVLEQEYTQPTLNRYPFLAHEMCIGINTYVQAPRIDWMRELVVLSKYTTSGNSLITLADYTLTFQQDIIQGGLNIFPKWGNKEKTIIYFTRYINDKPTILRYELSTNTAEIITQSDGMAVVSDVSSDGQRLLLSLTPNKGAADVYLYELQTKNLKRLTTFSGIDVGGKFINGEKEVAFVSDRLGYPNVFATNIEGGNVEQLVFHGHNNSSVASHDKYIVYTSRESNNEFGLNTFNIYLIATNSDFIRRLTEKGSNQMPTFSKDGKNIMYIKHTQTQSALGIIRLDYNSSYFFSLPKVKIQSYDW
ncbi:Tol-Pal system protein TolB [uncultured Helicobacter sp.]|uniref:Tol-Pal system protein TolB n=1 Tax=uncultured Helicobacter sp. TaxID=175537 RepID=UPI003751BB1F